MFLTHILQHKEQEVEALKAEIPLKKLQERLFCNDLKPNQGFAQALLNKAASGHPAIIAEVKKASPSRGLMRPDFRPVEIARAYEQHGAAAISVVTDTAFFGGKSEWLSQIRQAVGLPLLRKDFIIDRYQVVQSKLLGADCILLIARLLDEAELSALMTLAAWLQLECLVEVHDRHDVRKALGAGARLLGINNRDLDTFLVDLEATRRLIQEIPSAVTVVSESGIRSYNDMRRIHSWGAEAALIGEALLGAPSIACKLVELRGGCFGESEDVRLNET